MLSLDYRLVWYSQGGGALGGAGGASRGGAASSSALGRGSSRHGVISVWRPVGPAG